MSLAASPTVVLPNQAHDDSFQEEALHERERKYGLTHWVSFSIAYKRSPRSQHLWSYSCPQENAGSCTLIRFRVTQEHEHVVHQRCRPLNEEYQVSRGHVPQQRTPGVYV